MKGEKDVLRGYKISAIEITDIDFLEKGGDQHQNIAINTNDQDDRIEGTVFEVSEAELVLADKYEPFDYKRVLVVLESGKSAWIYAAF